MTLGDIFGLQWHPFVPPVLMTSIVIANEFQSILHRKKVLAISRLTNNIGRVSDQTNHLLCLESARFAFHRVVSLSKPDSALITRVKLSKIATTDGLVEGLIDICIRTCENSRHLLKHSSKCRIASLVKRLDRNLITRQGQVNRPVKEDSLLFKSTPVIAGHICTQKHLS